MLARSRNSLQIIVFVFCFIGVVLSQPPVNHDGNVEVPVSSDGCYSLAGINYCIKGTVFSCDNEWVCY